MDGGASSGNCLYIQEAYNFESYFTQKKGVRWIILAAIGAVLIFAQVSAEINSSIIFLAIGSALSLTIVEFIYVAKQVISPISLGDAFIELLLVA